VLGGAFVLAGCGGRPEKWDETLPYEIESIGLSGSVAVRDDPLNRLVMLTSPSERELATTALAVGRNIVHWEAGPRRQRLYVLAAGVQPRLNPDDELPSLTIVDGGGPGVDPFVVARYMLDDPPDAIQVDPEGEYAVVTVGGGVVENPNELLLVELPSPDATEPVDGIQPTAKTIRSFGSSPQAITFTPRMRFPDRERRLLIVQTEQEVALIDLEDPEQEVTVKLSEPLAGQIASRPQEVVFHDNQPDELGLPQDEDRYPLIAIRMENESTIPFLSFEPAGGGTPGAPDDPIETQGVGFEVTVNLAEVRAVPSDIDFFWTEVNNEPELRLAALLRAPVEGQYRAAMVDPIANRTDFVEVGAGYTQMTRVTDEAATESRTSDIALLWGQEPSVAFWELGTTGSAAHRSIEAHPVGINVTSVTAITRDDTAPEGADHNFGHLKILQGSGVGEFYVLDLKERETSPMLTPDGNPIISLSPDGQRAWVYQARSARFASLRFEDLHPTTLQVERGVTAVHDIAQGDGDGERAVFALHADGSSLGVTVLDATDPDTADTRFYGGILLGGL
jgi:hypothetical protein